MTALTLLAALLTATPADAAEILISPASAVVTSTSTLWGDPSWSVGGGIAGVDEYGIFFSSGTPGAGWAGEARFPLTFISGRTITAVTLCYQTWAPLDSLSFDITESAPPMSYTVLYADPPFSRASVAGQCDTQVVNVTPTHSLLLTVHVGVDASGLVGLSEIRLTTSK